jgi:dTMP kinase
MRFFSFDGVDGVGKSTQLQLFADWLRELGWPVVVCRDPGTTALGEALRQLLLDPHAPAIGRRAEMLIYMASRAQLVDEVIRPALEAGKIVVSDRFLLANVAYQGHAGGLPAADVWEVGRIAVAGIQPDCTFVLDMDVQQAMRRRERSPDRMEAQGGDFLTKVRQGFLLEAQRHPQHVVVIDASRPVDDVQQALRNAARPILPQPHNR